MKTEAEDALSRFGNWTLLIFASERDIARLSTGAERPLNATWTAAWNNTGIAGEHNHDTATPSGATTKIDREELWKDSDCVLWNFHAFTLFSMSILCNS